MDRLSPSHAVMLNSLEIHSSVKEFSGQMLIHWNDDWNYVKGTKGVKMIAAVFVDEYIST